MTIDDRETRLSATLRYVVHSLEELVREGYEDEIPECVYDAYAEARSAIGHPIRTFPGGPLDEHFHFIDYDPVNDPCSWCERHADEGGETLPTEAVCAPATTAAA